MASVIYNEKRALEIMAELDVRPIKGDSFQTQCMFETCMRIQNEETGLWEAAPDGFDWAVDKYQYSHGVCPDCYPKWFSKLSGKSQDG